MIMAFKTIFDLKHLTRGVTATFAGATCFLTTLLFDPVQPAAETRACRILKGQLAALPTTVRKSRATIRRSNEYKEAADFERRQKRAIRLAKRDARHLGCYTRSSRERPNAAQQCRPLLKKIKRMEQNLNKLSKSTARILSNDGGKEQAGIDRKRRNLQVRIAQECRTPEGANTEIASRDRTQEIRREARRPRRGFFQRLFGNRRSTSRYGSRDPGFDLNELAISGGVFRTLCVRVCDGYYFPISFATTSSNFATDEAICQASNPQTDMRLFVHLNPSETPHEMTDLAGTPYTSLPNAFRYRHELVGNDICPAPISPANLRQIAGINGDLDILEQPNLELSSDPVTQQSTRNAKPLAKPDIFNDPDTQYAKIGKFELKPVNVPKDDTLAASVAESYDPSEVSKLGIRVIGPTFLADQEAVELLQAPDQIQVQSTPDEGA